ncbi:MAG: hypothetical protein RL318_1186 [Fibrobacterota bacterium]|jgi:hypothetical protein
MNGSSKIIGLLALALALGGCSRGATESVAGGEDFPNTVSAIGVATQEALDSSGTWNLLEDMPLAPPSTSLDESIAPATARIAGRTAQDSSFMKVDLSDTASGIAIVYSTQVTDSLIETDTLAILWNEFAKDAPQGNEQILWAKVRKIQRGSLRSVHQSIEPAGTDTMVTALPGKSNRIRFRQTTSLGIRQVSLDMELDPGTDLSYDTENDNRIFWSRIVHLRGADTLEIDSWRDGDGDSIAVDRSSGKYGVVEFQRIVPTPVKQPLLRRFEEHGRLRVDPRDSTRNQPLRYLRTAEWNSGRVVTERVARPASDSDLVASDTAIVQRLSVLGKDTVRSAFRMLMGPDLSKDTGNRMLSLEVHVHKATGRMLTLSFVSDTPLRDGDPVRTGAVSLVEVRPGQGVFTVNGRMVQGALTARVSDGASLSGTGSWSASGELLLWKPD